MENKLKKLLETKAQGVSATSSIDEYTYDDIGYPLILKSKFSGIVMSALQAKLEKIQEHLERTGAVLLRGFEIDNKNKFIDLVKMFNPNQMEYTNRTSPRFEVAKNVYQSTTHPEDQQINMHSENSYAAKWPMSIAFCCIDPPQQNGETPIADNRLVLKGLSESTIAKFEKLGVRYMRNIRPGIGLKWQEVFQTNSKENVDEQCRKTGITCEWKDENTLRLWWNTKAIVFHPKTKDKIWFNHSFFFHKDNLDADTRSAFKDESELPFNSFYGDGSTIPSYVISEVRNAYQNCSVKFAWMKGDVLLLDNMLFAHGRMPYRGLRQILVSMF